MRILFLLFTLVSLHSSSQIGMGQWRLHVPNKNALDVVYQGNSIYTAFESGVMEYDVEANETSIWDNINGLSDINVSCLATSSVSESIFIGYETGNLDQITGSRVTNIPAIVLSSIVGDKKIYKIVEHQGFIYCATGFGIVKIDPARSEVKDSYYPNGSSSPIIDLAFSNDSIFALTNEGVLKGRLNNPALAATSQWTLDTRVPLLSGVNNLYIAIENVGNDLFISKNRSSYGNDSVFKITNAGFIHVSNTGFDLEITGLGKVEGKITLFLADGMIVYNSDFSTHFSMNSYSFSGLVAPSNAVFKQGNYWLADKALGLVKHAEYETSVIIEFEGPPRNTFYALDWQKDKLACVPGGVQGQLPIFSPAGVYFFKDEKWTYKDKGTAPLWNNINIHDNISVSINPKDPNKIALGGFSKYALNLMDFDGNITDTFTKDNSLLHPNFPGADLCLISDLEYDKDGNLWMLNGFGTSPLKLLTPQKEWYSFSLGSSAFNKQTRCMAIDYNNNIWMAINQVGLVGYNPGSSITDPSDDKRILLLEGETNGNLPSKEVTAIAVDFDNEIWIGTDNGFVVLYNSENAFDAPAGSISAQRIKLEFEGNVEFVLGNTSVTDIEVDGGNRKWFGTNRAGVVLLSADGLQIIKQFTTENSPIISDNIIDIEIDQKTGEVFIVTDKGLVSYRGDASFEDPDVSDVQIFPNPARPEFDGPITIQGIRFDSDVRITDVAGNLIFKTTSNGGTATWDGRTLLGENVVTGVYLIWVAPNNSKGRFVGKVVIAN